MKLTKAITKGLALGIVASNVSVCSLANEIMDKTDEGIGVVTTEPTAEERATASVVNAESTLDPSDISTARSLVNALPEGETKNSLQARLDAIALNLDSTLGLKNATGNVDIYIKCENMLSMTLDTNQITFDSFSGVEDLEKINAVNITINSSLPYSLNAYLPNEIQNSDKSKTMNKEILNIKENSEIDYKVFTGINQKLVLKDNNSAGNDLVHGIDIKLRGGIAHDKDVYKTTIKFEAEQK